MAKASSPKNTTPRKPSTRKAETATRLQMAASTHLAPGLEERIRQRAYELYEQEGRQEGRDEEYWLRAEAEVRGRKSA